MKKTIFALAIVLAVALMAMLVIPAAATGDKVYVCKYVGQPGDNERLQTGQNPIEVSVNAIPGDAVVGSYFADAQGRSYVLGFVPMVPEPTADSCPQPSHVHCTYPGLEDLLASDPLCVPQPTPCSSVGDWTLVGDAPEWVVASDLLSRTKTYNYAKYDLNYQHGVCETKTETETENLTTYCLNGITGQYWPSEVPQGATEGACGTRPVCTSQGTVFIDIGAPLPEGATPGACVPVEPQSTPIPPPVTGGSGGPGSPILPIAGTLALLTILGLALKSRKAIGPTK